MVKSSSAIRSPTQSDAKRRKAVFERQALPLTPFEKIAKRAGVKRISKDAVEEMRDVIEEIAQQLCEHAVRVSHHAGRRTVMKEDIEFVAGKKA